MAVILVKEKTNRKTSVWFIYWGLFLLSFVPIVHKVLDIPAEITKDSMQWIGTVLVSSDLLGWAHRKITEKIKEHQVENPS